MYCTSLQTLVTPVPVRSLYIGIQAFYGCESLRSVVISQGCTYIDDGAFGDCDALTYVSLPNTLTDLGPLVFSGSDALETITIPSSVRRIGAYCFDGCSSLTSIYFDNGGRNITSIGCIPNSSTVYANAFGDPSRVRLYAYGNCTPISISPLKYYARYNAGTNNSYNIFTIQVGPTVPQGGLTIDFI